MSDYRTLDYVRCRQFLDSRSTADEQVRNIKMFVDNWASLVLASDTPNYADHNGPLIASTPWPAAQQLKG